jgi:hypothetical protein
MDARSGGQMSMQIADTWTFAAYKMGVYKCIGELYKKKQLDVLHFLLCVQRVLCYLVQVL